MELVAVVGNGSALVEEMIDEIVVGDASADSRFLVTSSHSGDALMEALDMAEGWVIDGDNRVKFVSL